MSRKDDNGNYGLDFAISILAAFLTLILLQQCENNQKMDDIKYDVQEIKRDVWTIKYRTE